MEDVACRFVHRGAAGKCGAGRAPAAGGDGTGATGQRSDATTHVLDQATGAEDARLLRRLPRMHFDFGPPRQTAPLGGLLETTEAGHGGQCEDRRGQAQGKRGLGENSSNRSNRRRCEGGEESKKAWHTLSPVDGEAASGSGETHRRIFIAVNRVPKRLLGAWADAMAYETDAWTKQADEGMVEFPRWGLARPETKRMRICGLNVNDDPNEEDARLEEVEWTTDDLSGEFIDGSEVVAARKEETEFIDEIDLSVGKPPVCTK